jgi:S1-C subfamily serine protease
LQSAIARHRPGDNLDVEIWRRGQRKQLQVQLLAKDDPAFSNWFAQIEPEPERYPEREPRTPSTETFQLEDWGIGLRELTSRERDAFDTERGVYLAYVANGSVAAAGGLPRDVVLLRIGDEVVNTLEDAIRELGVAAESSDTVLLRVKQRNGLAAFFELEVPAGE